MDSSVPPFRYYVGCILIGAEIVLVENASHIASGGVGGLSIAINAWIPLGVGVLNLLVKFLLFVIVWFTTGRRMALWTAISAILVGGSAWALEWVSLPFHWPLWLAFTVIVTVGYLPTGLVMSRGYSSGGFSALAQVLLSKREIPIWATMTVLNGFSIILMTVAYGSLAGILTLLATLWQGPSIEFWVRWTRRVLDGQTTVKRSAKKLGPLM